MNKLILCCSRENERKNDNIIMTRTNNGRLSVTFLTSANKECGKKGGRMKKGGEAWDGDPSVWDGDLSPILLTIGGKQYY